MESTVLSRVIGARGLIQNSNMHNALEFLDVHRGKRQCIIDSMLQVSIAALAFMNSTRLSARTTGLSPISFSPKTDPSVFDLLGKRKR